MRHILIGSRAVPPPLTLRHDTSGPLRHKKAPDLPYAQPIPSGSAKRHGPACRIVVNRDTFRDPSFGETLEFHRPSPSFRESSMLWGLGGEADTQRHLLVLLRGRERMG